MKFINEDGTEIRQNIARSVQEKVTNVARHEHVCVIGFRIVKSFLYILSLLLLRVCHIKYSQGFVVRCRNTFT